MIFLLSILLIVFVFSESVIIMLFILILIRLCLSLILYFYWLSLLFFMWILVYVGGLIILFTYVVFFANYRRVFFANSQIKGILILFILMGRRKIILWPISPTIKIGEELNFEFAEIFLSILNLRWSGVLLVFGGVLSTLWILIMMMKRLNFSENKILKF